MSQNIPKQHLDLARHNENACNFLKENNTFPDWVITTAFYAALHYVSSVIFPYECLQQGKKKLVNDIAAYKNCIGSHDNKHKLMMDLVFYKCKNIGKSYSTLLELSYSSRYDTNMPDTLYSNRAQKYLTDIKSYCEKIHMPTTTRITAIRAEMLSEALSSDNVEEA
ncbi:hypothetical protein SAMN05428949_5466 [Chitinophaga sp. YR627]|uniref:hypothetical protein n=1 Tax=Chitinophaga sp. YR627 TaxID=1881041 RepID=UPI0008EAB50F|nr:hypothetical protein [Chitinophaga sp. YR627]SFO50458.1 hypothetical protein SAMN05428949_5466 [Chitinophaga sp. YR627]